MDEASFDFQVTAEDMTLFRQLSGDTNPLHDDEAFAQRLGFDGPVVYGGLLVAQVSRLLGNHMPGPGCVWHSLSMNFRSALQVGEPARLSARATHANPELGTLRVAITIEAGGRRVADGTAQALRPAGAPEAR
ncbi:MaoC/PaaZ C-terminal domain-containing protein [Arenibaculum sp.]|jgi:3-hydroxybutyryl-CoA dehydratase|uniref:MaoC/PaaZ C-terminal domain-containing protein n=1 Tax=Arenibaculum sp. TaxID=2865862 RepID=UPI002E153060|nr:MaoC/PaaZ C-terminal domain-containing protein [Arenibaculum sp.]